MVEKIIVFSKLNQNEKLNTIDRQNQQFFLLLNVCNMFFWFGNFFYFGLIRNFFRKQFVEKNNIVLAEEIIEDEPIDDRQPSIEFMKYQSLRRQKTKTSS